MKRILHIGMGSRLGGIEIFIMNLYRNIDRTRIQFDFINFSQDKLCFENEIKELGGKVYKVIPRRKNIKENEKMIEQIIDENNYQIIHFHINTLSYYKPIEICIKKKIKIIIHSHNEWKGINLKTLLLHRINKIRLPKNSPYIIKLACSEVAGKWIFGNSSFKVVKNAIELNRFKFDNNKREKIREMLKIKKDTTVIGHIGAFRRQKNHKFLIDIYKEYLKLNDNSMLLLLGDGDLKDKIEKKVNKLGIQDKVKFLGNRNDTEYFYSAFDNFIFPSLFEGLGIVLIEAQASGLNCIVSDVIPNKAIINKNVKKISLNASPMEWAECINMLDYKSYDRENILSEEMKEWDIKFLTKEFENLYLKII